MELEPSAWALVRPARETFADYADRWVAGRTSHVRTRTLASYRWLLSKYIVPEIGNLFLSQITAAKLSTVFNTMQTRGLSPTTVRLTHSVVRKALNDAVADHLLPANPCAGVRLPKKKRNEMRSFTPQEARRFLEAAKGDKYFAFWLLQIHSGLRPSETLALRWVDIHDNRVHVQRVVSPGKDGTWVFEEPKTSRSRRAIPLPVCVAGALRAVRAKQLEDRLRAGSDYSRLDLVFATPAGRPLDVRSLLERFKGLCRTACVPLLRMYDLRHTCASLLLAKGIHPKIVSELLGHSSISITMDVYSHLIPGLQEESLSVLEEILEMGT